MRDDDVLDGAASLPDDLARFEARLRALPLPAEPDWDTKALEPLRSHRWEWGPRAQGLAIAALALVGLGLGWVWAGGWRVEILSGRAAYGGVAFAGRVAPGGTLTTDATSRARLLVPGLGDVTLEPGGCVRRVRGRGAERRLTLERGTLHASIDGPPRRLVVGTSMGAAVDLGGAYTIAVDDSGRGRIDVTRGRVRFENGDVVSLVGAGLWCPLTIAGAGVPRRSDASDAFLAAVAVTDDPACQADDFALLLAHAEASDAITLWHLLPRVRGEVRRQVAERIAFLVEVPGDVTLDRVLALEPEALAAWWNALGVGAFEEWQGAGDGRESRARTSRR
jgi:hypothetical protein